MKKFIQIPFTKKKIEGDSVTSPSTNDHGFIDQIFSTYDSEVVSTSNFDPRKSIKYGSNAQAVEGIITEYCTDSTVHGFKYIGDRKRPLIERILWAVALVFSIYLCYYLIKTNWEKRLGGPVIITFDEKLTPVWKIPFPTVTVCPETKTNPSIYNHTDIIFKRREPNETLTSEEVSYIQAVAHMCTNNFFKMLYPEGSETGNVTEIVTAMTHLSLDDVYFKRKWRDSWIEKKKFRKVLTEEGPCYSFNSLDSKAVYREAALVEGTTFADNTNLVSGWSLEKGYNNTSSKSFPFRTSGFGVKDGLFLSLTGTPAMSDPLCQDTARGFKIIINTPGDVPQVSDIFLNIPFDQKVTISIIPEVVYSSDGIEQYNPESRNCYFQDERYLRYFKVYTQANCELECLSNHTLEVCGCVKFHMPRDESVPVCEHSHDTYFCHLTIKTEVLSEDFNKSDENIAGCNCLPTCKSILYRAEMGNSAPFKDIFNKNENRATSEISISFKEKSVKALRRTERYTIIDFIAACGGLLGLFMGVSILSLVELLSFLTIRLWINLRMRQKKRSQMKSLRENVHNKFSA